MWFCYHSQRKSHNLDIEGKVKEKVGFAQSIIFSKYVLPTQSQNHYYLLAYWHITLSIMSHQHRLRINCRNLKILGRESNLEILAINSCGYKEYVHAEDINSSENLKQKIRQN